jgi:hypothetical protein
VIFALKVVIGALLSIAFHLLLGWEWTALAGIAVGMASIRRGWLAGALSLVLGWGAILAYSFIVAPGPTSELTRIFGGLMGNLPAAATVALTLLIPTVIGALSGWLGALLWKARLASPKRVGQYIT